MGEKLSSQPDSVTTETIAEVDQDIEHLLKEIQEIASNTSDADSVLKPYGLSLRLITGETVHRAPIDDVSEYVRSRLNDHASGRIPQATDRMHKGIREVLRQALDALISRSANEVQSRQSDNVYEVPAD